MPGIAGVITAPSAQGKLRSGCAMIESMLHEPWYVSSSCRFDELGIAVGWVDHPNSYSGCLPLWNAARDVCLVFVGEHFPSRGENFAMAAQDTSVDSENAGCLVDLYEEKGIRFLEDLNGWFCGVLVDLRRRTVALFNDRYGLSRLYFHEGKDAFYFASEAKAILRSVAECRRLDQRALGEWFSCGCVLQNRTLFEGIQLMPGGSVWTFFERGRIAKERYFHPGHWEKLPVLKPAEYYERIKAMFPRVLQRYFRGPRGIGLSLTGGVDSRMIIAWMKETFTALPCYSFGGTFRDCADVQIARRLSELLAQPHTTISVGDAFLKQFPRLAEKTVYITDGAMDVSGAVELYVNRKAREIAPVRLTGNYGSEIVRSKVAFTPRTLQCNIFNPDFAEFIRQAAATYAAEISARRMSFIAFKQMPWHHYARLAVEQSQLTLRSPFLDNELVALVYQAPPVVATGKELSLRLIHDGKPDLGMIATDRGVTYPFDTLSNKARRSVQEFLAKAEYAYDYGMPGWLARLDHLLAGMRLERLFLGRQKFYHFRVWYRDQLAPHIKEVLLDQRTSFQILSGSSRSGRNGFQASERHEQFHRRNSQDPKRGVVAKVVNRAELKRFTTG